MLTTTTPVGTFEVLASTQDEGAESPCLLHTHLCLSITIMIMIIIIILYVATRGTRAAGAPVFFPPIRWDAKPIA